ncbi:ABC transporter ATP-binding protein [Paludibacterium paludis]|uniref:Iron ABC transporter ATP-binding protein n=1 Tax=Paludibacterium paludis TaxID=1225769 RepID=A0A918UBD1_9NEIS|nr:ABC transporter ATP-binding protein [Paludibacterium paludis]GGY22697.1 iron ABC transporter ATP-binding protein [Paludibacterium paludis]
MNAGLTIQDLSVAYGRRRILHSLTAEAPMPGEVVAVLGPNGSGKSTLLKALAALVPSRGDVRLDGRAVLAMSREDRARRVVYLPQALPPSVHLRVFESILVAGNAGERGLAQKTLTPVVQGILERLGIAHLGMAFLDELSGGQKQLAGLAQALVRDPELLLLDEPLSALDLHHQFQVMALIREETRRRGMVTLVVLHDINIALHHTDRVLLVADGGLAGAGRPEDVITPESLARVYGVRGRLERCSRGRLSVHIDALA